MTEIHIDTKKLGRDLDDIFAKASKDIKKNIRKEIGVAAKTLVKAQRKAVMEIKTTGGRGGGSGARINSALAKSYGPLSERQWAGLRKRSGLRMHAAASVRIINKPTPEGYQVTIKVEPTRMPQGQRKLPKHMDKGQWSHPLPGRKAWRSQSVTPGWFNLTAEKESPKVYEQLSKIIDKF